MTRLEEAPVHRVEPPLHALTELRTHLLSQTLPPLLLAGRAEVAEETGLVILTAFGVEERTGLAPSHPVVDAADRWFVTDRLLRHVNSPLHTNLELIVVKGIEICSQFVIGHTQLGLRRCLGSSIWISYCLVSEVSPAPA